MVVVAILLTSGVSLAAWKFHIPQKVAAVFTEPDVPAKKSAPMTARHTTVDATKTIPSTAATMTNAAVIQPIAQGVNNDVAQPITTASKSAVRKPSKSGTRVASAAAAATPSITTIRWYRARGQNQKHNRGRVHRVLSVARTRTQLMQLIPRPNQNQLLLRVPN